MHGHSMGEACGADLREAKVKMAATFLLHPAVKSGDQAQQLVFLKSKGVLEEEVLEARRRLAAQAGGKAAAAMPPTRATPPANVAPPPRAAPPRAEVLPARAAMAALPAARVPPARVLPARMPTPVAPVQPAVSSTVAPAVAAAQPQRAPVAPAVAAAEPQRVPVRSAASNGHAAVPTKVEDAVCSSSSSSSSREDAVAAKRRKVEGADSSDDSSSSSSSSEDANPPATQAPKPRLPPASSPKKVAAKPPGQLTRLAPAPAIQPPGLSTKEPKPVVGPVAGHVNTAAIKAAFGPVLPDGPVVYRSDSALWPPDVTGGPLLPAQRKQLAHLAASHGARLEECRRDLAEVEGVAAAGNTSEGEQETLRGLGEGLRAELALVSSLWKEEVEKLRRGWSSAPAVAIPAADGVRPLTVRGERWFCAVVPTSTQGRLLGPVRTSAAAAAVDQAALAKANAEAEARAAANPPAAATGGTGKGRLSNQGGRRGLRRLGTDETVDTEASQQQFSQSEPLQQEFSQQELSQMSQPEPVEESVLTRPF